MRCWAPSSGFLRPDEFIGELERHRLIHKLDLEVFERACLQWSEARERGIRIPFGINLSRLDFELCDIYGGIRAIMARYRVPVEMVHIEVTESVMVQGGDVVSEGVQRFRTAGFKVYMDDFGSGYSSLGQMAHLDFDVIKFDKSMVDHVAQDRRARAVVADTVTLVKRLGMQTLCEGVETEEQLSFLHAIGCEKAQGYYISRPVTHEQMLARLQEEAFDHEAADDQAYFDAIGQVNLLDGTSAGISGVDAATFLGSSPVAVIEFDRDGIHLLSNNLAYHELLQSMGFATFRDFVTFTTEESSHINQLALRAAQQARESGQTERFDFIIRDVFCSATMRLIAQRGSREAFLTTILGMENAPQITERTLLAGVLETSGLNFFWKDRQRRFLGANPHFLDYYGFADVDDILGKTDEDMGWNLDDTVFRSDELDVLDGASVSGAHGICMRGNEYRNIVATKRPLYSHGAIVGLVGYFVDLGPYDESQDAEESEAQGSA